MRRIGSNRVVSLLHIRRIERPYQVTDSSGIQKKDGSACRNDDGCLRGGWVYIEGTFIRGFSARDLPPSILFILSFINAFTNQPINRCLEVAIK